MAFKKDKFKISAIVPAYNEEKNISNLLKKLLRSKYVNQIICVNDGSTDNTLKKIKQIRGITIINLEKNHGKGYAIAQGIKKAKGDIVVFIDADLVGLNDACIKNLILPLVKQEYEATIGYPAYNNLDELFKPLSGERAYFKKDLLPFLKTIKKKGYGLELYLNYLYKDKRVKLFPLKGVKHILKHKKQSYDVVAKLTLIEMVDILSEILKQKNPLSYLIRSYLHPFYLKKPKKLDLQINKLINYIKKHTLTKI